MSLTVELVDKPKVYCYKCKWRGWGNSWDWCEFPLIKSGSKYVTGITWSSGTVRKMNKNEHGTCKDYQPRRRWWQVWKRETRA